MELELINVFVQLGLLELIVKKVGLNIDIWLVGKIRNRLKVIDMEMICSMYSFLSYLDIDDCQPNPCKNDGVCEDGANSYTCNCAHGFIGEDCSISMRQFFREVTCIWNQIEILYRYPYLHMIDIDTRVRLAVVDIWK